LGIPDCALAVLDRAAVMLPASTAALIAQLNGFDARFVFLIGDGCAVMTLAVPP
jgi:hypothetical protein